jgi:hypothetical protein
VDRDERGGRVIGLLPFFACTGPGKGGVDTAPVSTEDTAHATDTADTAGRDTSGDTSGDTATDTSPDSGSPDSGETGVPVVTYDPWPFIDSVVSYSPGDYAGFGQDGYPDVVYGPPESPGSGGGSLDVLSLGQEGSIIVAFRAIDVVDGPGVDLLVFENPLATYPETGVVGVSADGETWVEWPCDTTDAAGGYPGCAGVALVYASSTNGVDATDPDAAGGDRFDLADIGVAQARYVRVRDSGANSYAGISGGFDLDAVAVVNAVAQ